MLIRPVLALGAEVLRPYLGRREKPPSMTPEASPVLAASGLLMKSRAFSTLAISNTETVIAWLEVFPARSVQMMVSVFVI